MSWAQCHKESERLAEAAHESLRQTRAEQARTYFEQAAQLEQQALSFLDPTQKARTYSITALSATALWYKAEAFVQAHQVALMTLATRALDPYARTEIKELLEAIYDRYAQAAAGLREPAFLLRPGQSMTGRIVGGGGVAIEGSYVGDILVLGTIAIERAARVEGMLSASAIYVRGEFRGQINHAGRVEIVDTGIVTGDINALSVAIAPGARLRGQLNFGWGDTPRPASSITDRTGMEPAQARRTAGLR